jgi:hypothetical protein
MRILKLLQLLYRTHVIKKTIIRLIDQRRHNYDILYEIRLQQTEYATNLLDECAILTSKIDELKREQYSLTL